MFTFCQCFIKIRSIFLFLFKHYFEFDFCLTDRKLASPASSSTPAAGAGACTREASASSSATSPPPSAQKLISPNSTRRFSITSKLQKLQSDTLFQAALMPLFSQPSSAGSKGAASSLGSANNTREDSLLLQIRHDINQMVKIPTNSASSRSGGNGSSNGH